jgi:hypothetical protein
MKLDSSIVILKGKHFGTQDIDLVLKVKHPQGIDPADRIQAAVNDFLNSYEGKRFLEETPGYSWSDLISWMCPADWANHELYVESAQSWVVMEEVQKLDPAQLTFEFTEAE